MQQSVHEEIYTHERTIYAVGVTAGGLSCVVVRRYPNGAVQTRAFTGDEASAVLSDLDEIDEAMRDKSRAYFARHVQRIGRDAAAAEVLSPWFN